MNVCKQSLADSVLVCAQPSGSALLWASASGITFSALKPGVKSCQQYLRDSIVLCPTASEIQYKIRQIIKF